MSQTEYDALCKQAQAHHRDGEYDLAIAAYSRAIEMFPEPVQAYLDRASVYNSKQNHAAELDDYTAAIQLAPSDWRPYARRADLLIYLNGPARREQVLADYAQAIERLNPDNFRLYHTRASMYEWIGEYDKALADHTSAIKLRPDNPYSYYTRARLYERNNDYDHALSDYNSAIVVSPDDAYVYLHRAEFYNKRGEQIKALADYDRAIELCPDEAVTYRDRAYLYFAMGEDDKGFADYAKVIELEPDKAMHFSNRAMLYRHRGEYALALVDYERALALEPQNYHTYVLIGDIYVEQKEFGKAIASYNQALTFVPVNIVEELARHGRVIAPPQAFIYISRARAQQGMGVYAAAIADCDEAIRLDANNDYFYAVRGYTHLLAGHRAEAIADFKAILVMGEDKKQHEYAKQRLAKLGAD